MQTRVLGLLLLTGCYVPLADADESAPQCSDRRCTGAEQHVRTLRAVPEESNTSTLGISIALPPKTVDCSEVLLAVVGARRAVLGERVVLEAAMSGDEETEPSLRWKSEDMKVTVVGPDSAEVSCDTIGLHTVGVELAPPAPCPAAVRVEVDCVTAD